ncbi:MAG: hypothetical protein PWQ83_1953, partial [Thermosipho sp. (in: thermotogales)]|nr:hypothetical protein [Thermosipho sp. (in: thermotogales)]
MKAVTTMPTSMARMYKSGFDTAIGITNIPPCGALSSIWNNMESAPV